MTRTNRHYTAIALALIMIFAAGCAGWGTDGPDEGEDLEPSEGDADDLEEADGDADDESDTGDEADDVGETDGTDDTGETEQTDDTDTGTEPATDADADDDSEGSTDGADTATQQGDEGDTGDDGSTDAPPSDADESDDSGAEDTTPPTDDGNGDESPPSDETGDGDAGDGESPPVDDGNGDAGNGDDNGESPPTDSNGDDNGDNGESPPSNGDDNGDAGDGDGNGDAGNGDDNGDPDVYNFGLTVPVVDEAGDPVEGQTVLIGAPDVEPDEYTTDANGEATLEMWNSDRDDAVMLEATVDGETRQTHGLYEGNTMDPFVVSSNGDNGDDPEETHTLTLIPGSEPVPGTFLLVEGESNDVYESATSDDGEAVSFEVPDGEYLVGGEEPSGFTETVPLEIDGSDEEYQFGFEVHEDYPPENGDNENDAPEGDEDAALNAETDETNESDEEDIDDEADENDENEDEPLLAVA